MTGRRGGDEIVAVCTLDANTPRRRACSGSLRLAQVVSDPRSVRVPLSQMSQLGMQLMELALAMVSERGQEGVQSGRWQSASEASKHRPS